MNTMDQLRATLAEHADLVDDGLVARTASVAGRVRAVRRRRGAVGAGVMVAAVAGALGLSGLDAGDGPPEPTGPTLVGIEVPETVAHNGFTFYYADGVTGPEGAGSARIRLAAADEPRVVTWATEDEGQTVVVHADGQKRQVTAADFTERILLQAGVDYRIRVAGDDAGTVALATYELGDPPAGVTEDGVTFRQQIDGRELIAADIGDTGQTEISVTVTLPERLWISYECSASGHEPFASRQPFGSVYVDGWFAAGIGCEPWGPGKLYDVGTSGIAMTDPGETGVTIHRDGPGDSTPKRSWAPGEEVTITIRLTGWNAEEWQRPVPSDIRLLLGVYSAPAAD